MHIPKEIIEKAIEGGWRPENCRYPTIKSLQIDGVWFDVQNSSSPIFFAYEVIVLDPTFWQSLGKSLGWEESEPTNPLGIPKWRNEAGIFYDLILTNQPTDIFWQELLHN